MGATGDFEAAMLGLETAEMGRRRGSGRIGRILVRRRRKGGSRGGIDGDGGVQGTKEGGSNFFRNRRRAGKWKPEP